MENGKRFCKNCQKETYYEREVMPEGYPHYAKRICGDCGKFIDWMKKPKVSQSQKDAQRTIELKKQALQLLTEEFHAKYSSMVIEIYELEIEYAYATDNNFWKEDEPNLSVVK